MENDLKKIAIFDFDGTITKHDSMFRFILFSKGFLMTFLGLFLYSPIIVLYKIGIISNELAKQKLFAFYFRNMKYDDFIGFCELFALNIENDIRIEARNQLKKFNKENIPVNIVSASIDEWIKPWALKNGIHSVIATKIEIDENGLLTGRFASRNCYGLEKVNRLKDVLSGDEYIIVYGDSDGDKELLKYADESYYQLFEK